MHDTIRTQSAFEVNFGQTGMMMAGHGDMRWRMCM
jgi:hypothetical protein